MLLSWASGYGVPIYIMRPVLWLVGGVSLAFLAIRKRDQIVTIATPGTVMFLIAIGVVGVLGRDLVLLSWDEFAHWGQVAKFLAVEGRYPGLGDVFLGDYPFGTAIWQVLIGGDSESRWILAQSVLKFAALGSLFAAVGWHRPHVYVPLAAYAVAMMYFFLFMGGLADILPDTPLALFTGVALVVYYRGGRDFTAIVLATVISASLPLFKEIGLMFAAAIAVVIAVDQLLVKHLGGRSSWRMLLAAAMPFVAAFVVHRVRGWMLDPTVRSTFRFDWPTIRQVVQTEGYGERFVQTIENSKPHCEP